MGRVVAIEGVGITGSRKNYLIQTHAVTRRMGLAFVFFPWWIWVEERHAIGNGNLNYLGIF